MKIEKSPSLPRRLAEEAATILGMKSENVMVRHGPEGIEVTLGELTKAGWTVTGDVPPGKVAAVTAWAKALLAETK